MCFTLPKKPTSPRFSNMGCLVQALYWTWQEFMEKSGLGWNTAGGRSIPSCRTVHTFRDQKPMPPQALARCVIGMQPADWYRLINSKVFFWLDPDRLNRQRQACEPRPQIMLLIDTTRLLDRYGEKASVSPINSGNARRKPASRGRSTFVSYASWSESGWESESAGLGTRTRPRSHQPVELTIDGAVPDIMNFVIRVQRLESGESF